MKIIISRQEIQAALLFASTDESRLVLNSLLIEARSGKTPLIIATDGRRLAVIESQAEQINCEPCDGEMVLRSDFLKPICALNKTIGGKLFPWIGFETQECSKRVQVEFLGGNLFLEAHDNALVEGDYPNWRATVPDKSEIRQPVSELAVNAMLIADFVKVAKFIGRDDTGLRMNLAGPGHAMEVNIPSAPHFYGLIMPLETKDPANFQPEFIGMGTKVEPSTRATSREKSSSESSVTISSAKSSVTLSADGFKKLATLSGKLIAK